MNQLLMAGLFILAGSQAMADGCRLQTPVALPAGFPDNGLVMKNAVFDEVPRFTDPKSYVPGVTPLWAEVIPVSVNEARNLYVGAKIRVDKTLEHVGVSDVYSGNFEGSGAMTESNGERVYTFRQAVHYDGTWEEGRPRHVKGVAITESRITVANGRLTSFFLTIPLYTVWKEDGLETYTAFTGEHQSLCLQKVLN